MIYLPDLTVELLELQVEQLYRLDCAGVPTQDPIQGEAVVRWLDANVDLLARVWRLWAAWRPAEERDLRRYWLDAVLLGGIVEPEQLSRPSEVG